MLKNEFKRDCASFHLKDRNVKHIRVSDAQKVYDVYDFKEEIGHGTFGIVVLAVEKSNTKQWAVKIVHKNIAGATKLIEVNREIQILKVVDHQNIIYLSKVYESPKKLYMVLELCKAELYKIYKHSKPLSEKVTRRVIYQLADAVSYLHKNDVVHRDIKMENILIADNPKNHNDEYFIKLTDFGLSIVKEGVGIQSLMKDYCGTVLYMPPEILQMKTYSELCDVWSIGIIMYMMLYGSNPFYNQNEEILMHNICFEEPKYITEGVSEQAIQLLKCILEKDPVQRMTASQIKEHPWISEKEGQSLSRGQNIVEMMKQFRFEMNSLTDRKSRGMSIICDGLELPSLSNTKLVKAGIKRSTTKVHKDK
ncbi:serine/threonine-protein kinase 33-like isoform X2 [Sitophilus oryzae]|uniref:Serine/threonine-protein kinase 33-like isoform X2 n=1 Tax=Sitophilus oryzae TaxID=7048 RepID=A0A6J2YKG9_SITOR|nr:serine/threonine-protein kinase 33-like isoform X2 [Sitophilus oryzae]